MPTPGRSRLLVSLLVLTGLGATARVAKDPVGVYALIDRVVFEPDAQDPERVQLWGSFRVADTFGMENGKLSRIDLGRFHAVEQGYMYFRVNDRNPEVTRAEWSEMAALAGTGQPIAFGARVPSELPALDEAVLRDTTVIRWLIRYNGRVRSADERPVAPDTFPMRMSPYPPRLKASRTSPAVQPLLDAAGTDPDSSAKSHRRFE